MLGKIIRGIKSWSKFLLLCTCLTLAHLWTCLWQQLVLLHKCKELDCWITSLKISTRSWGLAAWSNNVLQDLYTALCLLGWLVIKDYAVGRVLAALVLGIQPRYSFVSILHSGYHTGSAQRRSKNIFKKCKGRSRIKINIYITGENYPGRTGNLMTFCLPSAVLKQFVRDTKQNTLYKSLWM